ncbi:MAG: helix-turn-helix domain-containing protein, partial [Deltaproteobacteria bacterium]|nr:helix-turn-helix domain-containing protein [Deltaproteobacteria bacterium]
MRLNLEQSIIEGELEVKELFEYAQNNAAQFEAYEMERDIFARVMQIGLAAMKCYFAEKGKGDIASSKTMEEAISRKSQRPKLQLDKGQHQKLIKIIRSRTAPIREVQRAGILLSYAAGRAISSIKKELNISRPTIYKCIDKALAAGVETGLKDKYHRPKDPVITEEAKAWVVNLACTKPKDHGYAAEIWTLSHLAKHTRKHAPAAGHECLNRAVKATIYRILKSQPLKPHKIRYYLEQRDEEFDKK